MKRGKSNIDPELQEILDRLSPGARVKAVEKVKRWAKSLEAASPSPPIISPSLARWN